MSREAPDSWKRLYFLRIQDLIDKYKPDMLYTDGGIPFGEWGYKLVSHYYNRVPNGLYTSKTKKDCEEGTLRARYRARCGRRLLPNPWQTDTCIGGWHYKKDAKYKSGKNVMDLLCDIVSRNGNLMLNVPLPNSGKPDDDELKTVEEITKWMAVNSEGIYSTRPWKIAGSAAPPVAGNTAFNERNRRDLTAADVRYTVKNETLYAFVMGWPEHEAVIPTLALGGTNQVARSAA